MQDVYRRTDKGRHMFRLAASATRQQHLRQSRRNCRVVRCSCEVMQAMWTAVPTMNRRPWLQMLPPTMCWMEWRLRRGGRHRLKSACSGGPKCLIPRYWTSTHSNNTTINNNTSNQDDIYRNILLTNYLLTGSAADITVILLLSYYSILL